MIKAKDDDPQRQKEQPNELNLDEFIRLMAKEINENVGDEELIECFKEFGAADELGSFDIKQLGQTMEKNEEKLSTEDLELLFDETDRDKDGTIDFKDFMRMMMSK